MPAPLPITIRVRALLKARGLTVDDLAVAIGRTRPTIKNVINGATRQIPTQQALTDYLGAEIFPGIRPRAQSFALKLPAGTTIVFPKEAAARAFESLPTETRKRDAKRIEILKDTIIRIPAPPPINVRQTTA